jgi:iron complex outermembrane receptor protein
MRGCGRVGKPLHGTWLKKNKGIDMMQRCSDGMIERSTMATSAGGLAGVLSTAIALVWGQTIQAADTSLEEIVVTAQKREQNIQDVGISITALSGAQLAALGIQSTDAIADMTPGVFIASAVSQQLTIFTIRGVSQNDFSDQNEAPNAVYFDGAYNSFIGSVGTAMFDVDRVEVLRGPQGTLFGRNATGGLVHIISRKPTQAFEGYGKANAGERNLREFEGAISGPFSDALSARLSVATRNSDGYIRNTLGGTLQGTDNLSGRLQFQWLPTQDFDVLLNLHGTRDRVDDANGYQAVHGIADAGLVSLATSQAEYAAFCNGRFDGNTPAPLLLTSTSACSGAELSGNPYRASVDNTGIMERDTHGATLTATAEISAGLSLVAISDYQALQRDASSDTDATYFRMFNFFSNTDSSQYSQEVRLQGEHGAVNWTGGIFYLNIDHDIRTGIDAVPDANTLATANPDTLFPFMTDNRVHQTTKSYAVFGQAETRLNDRFSLIAGARWSEDRKQIDIDTSCGGDLFLFACNLVAPPGSVQGDGFDGTTNPGRNRQDQGDWSGKLELDFHPNDDWLVYASVNRGQKGGGFNASAIAGITAAVTPYRPEILTSYEMGFKSTLLGGTTRVNSSAFYYDYNDYQAFTLTGLTPTIFNTDATAQGFEVEVQSSPLRALDVSLGVAYLDAIAHDVPLNLLGGRNLGDQNMPQSPEWSLNGSARYSWDVLGGQVALHADARYVDKRYFNTVNHPGLVDEGYTVVNGRLSYTSGDERWEMALWVRNITDEVFYPIGYDLTGTNGTIVRAVSPPRWAGASLSFHW